MWVVESHFFLGFRFVIVSTGEKWCKNCMVNFVMLFLIWGLKMYIKDKDLLKKT